MASAIDMMRMRRAGQALTFTLIDGTVADVQPTPDDATSALFIRNDLTVSSETAYSWASPGAVAADYEVVVTITGGSPGIFSTGSAGTFNLGTTRTWTRARTLNPPGISDVIATFQIRRVDTPAVILATASITLSAEVV